MDEDEPEIAVALRYDADRKLPPYLTAKGRELIARQIKEIAEAHGVPVRKDADLVQVLEALDINTPIPVPLFAAVAEIIAHLYTVNQELRDGGAPAGRGPGDRSGQSQSSKSVVSSHNYSQNTEIQA